MTQESTDHFCQPYLSLPSFLSSHLLPHARGDGVGDEARLLHVHAGLLLLRWARRGASRLRPRGPRGLRGRAWRGSGLQRNSKLEIGGGSNHNKTHSFFLKKVSAMMSMGFTVTQALQCGASGCEKGFVKCFLKVPLACFSMAAAVIAQHLWNILRNLTPQTVQGRTEHR